MFPALFPSEATLIFACMETVTVVLEGDCQTVRLPKGVYLPTETVFVRQEGETVVLEPARPKTWPAGFFDSIHISDPAFVRPEQGQLPPIKNM
jgi:virulence-associated protein VagC